MIDLRKTTFIIPVYLESQDRVANFKTVIPYLTKHLDTNIIILEWGTKPMAPSLIEQMPSCNSNIQYSFLKQQNNSDIFHRTRFLNIMLFQVKTPVTVNYDIDILLEPGIYKESEKLILSGQDLVYPYFWGSSQYRVKYDGRNKISQVLSLDCLCNWDIQIERSEYGHCQFFNSASYREGGMENEGFVSYGPEDQERGYRFKKLGYNVIWGEGYVYHLEHSRGINSSSENPAMQKNNKLFEYLKSLSEDELKNYYKNIDYVKKYL